jgi:hypothetical protein
LDNRRVRVSWPADQRSVTGILSAHPAAGDVVAADCGARGNDLRLWQMAVAGRPHKN